MTGTPADRSDEKVVQNRASATLWVRAPNTGGRSLKASHFLLPLGVAIHRRIRTTIDDDDCYDSEQPDAGDDVGYGDDDPRRKGKRPVQEVNSRLKMGTMKIIIAVMITMTAQNTMVGYAIAERTF